MKVHELEAEVRSRGQLPWLSLILLLAAYTLVGWNLAAHHVIWYMGGIIIALAMTLSWVGSRWIKQILEYIPTVLRVVFAVSILITLTLTSSLFLNLIFVPLLTTFFAWNEMRFFKLGEVRSFWVLLLIPAAGLIAGELLDFWILPSSRY